MRQYAWHVVQDQRVECGVLPGGVAGRNLITLLKGCLMIEWLHEVPHEHLAHVD